MFEEVRIQILLLFSIMLERKALKSSNSDIIIQRFLIDLLLDTVLGMLQ